jgi:hypothetical protein
MVQHVFESVRPLLSTLSDMVCLLEEIHKELISSKLHSVLSEKEKKETDQVISRWLFQMTQAIKVFAEIKSEIGEIDNLKKKK